MPAIAHRLGMRALLSNQGPGVFPIASCTPGGTAVRRNTRNGPSAVPWGCGFHARTEGPHRSAEDRHTRPATPLPPGCQLVPRESQGGPQQFRSPADALGHRRASTVPAARSQPLAKDSAKACHLGPGPAPWGGLPGEKTRPEPHPLPPQVPHAFCHGTYWSCPMLRCLFPCASSRPSTLTCW